jgi:hypothetical protein
MESIGFTMMFFFFFIFFFFVFVITFWGSKNASTFLNSNLSERKFGQVKNQTFSILFKSIQNHKKITKKREFLRKTTFWQTTFFFKML